MSGAFEERIEDLQRIIEEKDATISVLEMRLKEFEKREVEVYRVAENTSVQVELLRATLGAQAQRIAQLQAPRRRGAE